jgi:hypothetical protein
MMSRHELFDELDAFDPKWQINYKSVISAAKAARCEWALSDWLSTHQGETYLSHIHATRDYLAEVEEYRLLREKEFAALPFGFGSKSYE